MNDYEAHWLWYDFANIAGSAVMRSQNVDAGDPHIDWKKQHQAVRIAGLSFACAILETLNRKNSCLHTRVLFHLRNAVLHNSGNIYNNIGHPKPFEECAKYLEEDTWKEVFTIYKDRERKHFSIDQNGQVIIENSFFRFVERLLDSYKTDEERKLPPPRP